MYCLVLNLVCKFFCMCYFLFRRFLHAAIVPLLSFFVLYFFNSSLIIAEDSNFCNVCNKSFNLLLKRILYNEIIQYDTSLTEQKRTEVTHYGNDFKMVRFQI